MQAWKALYRLAFGVIKSITPVGQPFEMVLRSKAATITITSNDPVTVGRFWNAWGAFVWDPSDPPRAVEVRLNMDSNTLHIWPNPKRFAPVRGALTSVCEGDGCRSVGFQRDGEWPFQMFVSSEHIPEIGPMRLIGALDASSSYPGAVFFGTNDTSKPGAEPLSGLEERFDYPEGELLQAFTPPEMRATGQLLPFEALQGQRARVFYHPSIGGVAAILPE